MEIVDWISPECQGAAFPSAACWLKVELSSGCQHRLGRQGLVLMGNRTIQLQDGDRGALQVDDRESASPSIAALWELAAILTLPQEPTDSNRLQELLYRWSKQHGIPLPTPFPDVAEREFSQVVRLLLDHLERGWPLASGGEAVEEAERRRAWQQAIENCHRCILQQALIEQLSVDRIAGSHKELYDLAYGLSHEINNPLGNISARAQVLLGSESDPAKKRYLTTIAQQAQRAHEMLAELMYCVQPPQLTTQRIDLSKWLQSLRQRLESLCQGYRMRLELPATPAQCWTHLDPAAMEEVLRCSVKNACEASRPGDPILIQWQIRKRKENWWIVVSVRDHGVGLQAGEADRAWNLYYSGRESGRGLGLGLARIDRLMGAHGGWAEWNQTGQVGCCLDLYLPHDGPP
jgi:signal transduction histidine kinase